MNKKDEFFNAYMRLCFGAKIKWHDKIIEYRDISNGKTVSFGHIYKLKEKERESK